MPRRKPQTTKPSKRGSENEFTLRFESKQHQIDATTLIATLDGITTAIQEINGELRTDKQIDIVVKALSKGSFLIRLDLLETFVVGLFNKEGLDIAHKLLNTLVQVLSLRKLLKGKKPAKTAEQEEEVMVTNEQGESASVDKSALTIYSKNPIVNKSLTNAFDTLYNDSSVNKFEIHTHRGKVTFEAKREDFQCMSLHPDLPADNSKVETEEATLTIVRMAFENKYKWDYYWKGNKISARVVDPDFHMMIDKGERFAKGDSLVVLLEVAQVFDSTVGVFINDTYVVRKVLKHVPRGEQTSIDFGKKDL